MKIQDLLEAEFETNKQDKISDNLYDIDKQRYRYRNRKYDALSRFKSGAYGKIYRSKDNPHQITKIPHYPQKADAYYDYIEHVVNSGIAKINPHFPRIYDIKKITDKSGHFKYKIKMETLQHFSSIEPKTINGMLQQYYGYDNDDDSLSHQILMTNVRKNVKGSLKSNDDTFNEACKFVADFIRNGNYSEDLHMDNIMVRLAPYPQLVFVDPVVFDI